jgi:hypothetical protein|tara:strand:+ start:2075 stop:2242 length:168 start_codon:yes stop_codon:yes gene_type:complete
MSKVKIMMSISVDPDEYSVPSDGRIGEEIEDYITDVIHELDGVKITSIRSITEET